MTSLRADGRPDAATGTKSTDYVFAPIDKLLEELRRKMTG